MTHRDRPNAATALDDAGQRIWLDNINRAMLRTGSLARYIEAPNTISLYDAWRRAIPG